MTTLSRAHRTALFVDGEALKTNAEYRERVQRLNQSLNGPNIKTDIYTVFPETNTGIVKGLQSSVPATPAHDGKSLNVARLQEIGRQNGYVQTLVSLPTR